MQSRKEMYENVKLCVDNGKTEDAVQTLEKLLEAYPDFGQAHFDLGYLYFEMGQNEKALEHYHESIALEPDNTVFSKSLADLYYTRLDNADEAVKLYHMVLETDPGDCETIMILGNLAVVENEFEKARDFYQRVLAIEPWNAEASEFVEKIDHKLAHDAGIQTPEALYQKSQELFQSGNIEGAIKELKTMLALQPESALVHNDLGVLYYHSGCKDKCLPYYEEAVRLEPDNSVYQKNLADFYFVELNRVQEALEIYLRILTEDPTDTETLMSAGHICKALGSSDKAKVFYNRVLELEPWNFEANENLNQINLAEQTNFKENALKNQL